MAEKPIFEKKNILVTGGAGFIGSLLCEALLKEGRVICVDNFITSQEANIDSLLKNPDFEFIRHDISTPLDPEAFPELLRFKIKFQGIQEIYNLACPTSPKKFEQYKMQTLYANSLGMKNVLDLAVRYKSKVVHASTSVVYGPRPEDGHFFKEDEWGSANLLSPRACYDEGKRYAESVCATYQQVHGIDVRLVRIFRTYGPRMPLFDGHMIPDFITNALEGKPLEIFGDETFKTSLVYVSDLVDGMRKVMEQPEDIGPVNFGSDVDVPIVDVANRILEMTGSSSKIDFKGSLVFMTPLGLPDLSKAKEKLGWIPLVTLDDGLKKTIDYTIASKSLLTFRSV
ncbi:NAD-dependent dehydratase [Candidatus Uhrbacteria bacterium CG22_combo_CG10-13_8_21_14_all_47_17]|uniref:NAD-dependent dehydratase n=1 Tax=Candidatus Uhrbacteria bacterium CG22_combo_CG10-13_8_21_14_all_47_17 TaxID=1975041 RepID=A0A2H0BT75_9BACT|nr:MAG: NAD-dependent dehydratase [Candidatus Uhrbacteria bacterium CG22_combo_CG10-13_8_21_14_all_47_17]